MAQRSYIGEPDQQPAAPAPGRSYTGAPNPDPLRDAVTQAQQTPADRASRIFEVRMKTGLPEAAVDQNLDELERELATNSFNPAAFRKQHPELAQWLEANPLNAAATSDDLDALGAVGSVLRFAGDGLRSLGAGTYAAITQVPWAAIEFAGDLNQTVTGVDNGLAAYARSVRHAATDTTSQIRGDQSDRGFTSRAVLGGLESVGLQVPVLLASLFSGGSASAAATTSLTGMGAQAGLQSYGEARDKNVPPLTAALYGTSQGLVEVATERIPAIKFFEDLKLRAPLMRFIRRQLAAELPGEQVATLLQDLNEWAVINPDQPFSSYLETRFSAAAQTAIATLVQASVQSSAFHVVEKLANKSASQQVVEDLTGAAGATKTQQRAKAVLRSFVDSASQQGLTHISVPGDTFNEYFQRDGGNAEAKAEELGVSPESLREALQTGGDIAIPTGLFVEQVTGSGHEAFFAQEARLHPNLPNAREWKAMQAPAAQAELQALEADLARDVETSTVETKPSVAIARMVYKEARQAGVSELEARSVAAFYGYRETERANAIGVDPVEFYQSHPYQVVVTDKQGRPIVQPPTPRPAPPRQVVEIPESRAAAGETREARRARVEAHTQALELQVLGDARQQDPNVDAEFVAREFRERLAVYQDGIAETLQTGQDPVQLLRDIASNGGLQTTEDLSGEIGTMKEGTRFGAVNGVAGVFRNGGLPVDVMLQRLQQDNRYSHIEDENQLLDLVNAASRPDTAGSRGVEDALPGTADLATLGVHLGERWWNTAPWMADPTLRRDPEDNDDAFDGDAVGDEGDDSFNPDELEQRELTPEQRARATALYRERVTPGGRSHVHLAKALMEAGVALPSKTAAERRASNALVSELMEQVDPRVTPRPLEESDPRVRELEALASEEALGIEDVPESEQDALGQSTRFTVPGFEAHNPVNCTSCAEVFLATSGATGVVVGYPDDSNSGAIAPGMGHDFAIVDGRFLVDPWAHQVEQSTPRAVFDLHDPQDAAYVKARYAPEAAWTERVERDGTYAWVPYPAGSGELEQRDGDSPRSHMTPEDERLATLEMFGTGQQYMRVPFPVERTLGAALYMAAEWDQAVVEDVPLDQIVASQSGVKTSVLREKLAGADKASTIGVRYQGKVYLLDGHHRATAAWAKGAPTVRVRVSEVQDLEALERALEDFEGLSELPEDPAAYEQRRTPVPQSLVKAVTFKNMLRVVNRALTPLARAAGKRLADLTRSQRYDLLDVLTRKRAITKVVKAALRAANVKPINPQSDPHTDPHIHQYLVRAMLADALTAIQSNKKAVGWYDLKVSQALQVVALMHPEILTNQDAKFAFAYALANTSNGLKVGRNFELAEECYRDYKQNGVFPTNKGEGKHADTQNQKFELFNAEVATRGLAGFRQFMVTKTTVRDVKAQGFAASGEGMDEEVYGAMLLGAKLGNGFFMNLWGVYDQLTMDLWFVRTWARYTNTLFLPRAEVVVKNRARLRAAIAAMTADQRVQFGELIGADLTGDAFEVEDAAIDAIADAVRSQTERGPVARQPYYASPATDEFRKAGNILSVNLIAHRETPHGASERQAMRAVAQEVLAELQKRGHHALTMADLQAVLWYGEKDLYDDIDEDNLPDYAVAAVALATKQGVHPRRITRALARGQSAAAKRTRAARSRLVRAAGAGAAGRSTAATAKLAQVKTQAAAQPKKKKKKTGGGELEQRTRTHYEVQALFDGEWTFEAGFPTQADADHYIQNSRFWDAIPRQVVPVERPAPASRDAELDRLDEELQNRLQRIRDASGVPGVVLEAHLAQGGEVYLDQISVPRSRQDEGVGGRMLRQLLVWADAHDLAVSLDQAPAPRKKGALARFYKRHGFIRNGTARFYDASLAGAWVRPSRSDRLHLNGRGNELEQRDTELPHGATVVSDDENGDHEIRLPGAGSMFLIEPSRKAQKFSADESMASAWNRLPSGYLFIDAAAVKRPRQGDGRKLYEAAMAFAKQRGFRGLSSDPDGRNSQSNGLWAAMERDGAVRREAINGFDVVEHTGGEYYQTEFDGEPLDGFYSRVLRAVDNSKQTKATGAQWKATIKNAGVNLDEFQALAIDALEDRRVYTRAELRVHIGQHQVEVRVVTLSEQEGFDRKDAERIADERYSAKLDEWVADALEDAGGPGVYVEIESDDSLIEEEGEIWSVVMRDNDGSIIQDEMVDSEEQANQLRDQWEEEIQSRREEDLRDIAAHKIRYDDILDEVIAELDEQDHGHRVRYTSHTEPGADEGTHREVFLTAPRARVRSADAPGLRHGGFTVLSEDDNFDLSSDPHYSQIVEAVRTGDHAKAQEVIGTAIRALEGRPLSQKLTGMLRSLRELAATKPEGLVHMAPLEWQDGHDEYSHIPNPIVRIRFNTRTGPDGDTTLFLEEVQPPGEDDFPHMPALFQAHWRELAFKWALRYAAVHRYDQIAWTTGDMQVERYNLRKVADRIVYLEGQSLLLAFKDNTEVFREYHVAPEHLPKFISGELTKRMLASPLVHGGDGYKALQAWDPRTQQTRWGVFDVDTDEQIGPLLDSEAAAQNVIDRAKQALGRELGHPRRELTGDQLEIGGIGLKRLYDEDFKKVVTKLVKKAGGRVETLQVPFGKSEPRYVGPEPTVTRLEEIHLEAMRRTGGFANVLGPVELLASAEAGDAANTVLNTMQHNQVPFAEAFRRLRPPVRAELAKALGGRLEQTSVVTGVPGVYLSPAIGETFTQDQALYADEGGVLRGSYNPTTRTIKLIAGAANLTTMLHESGHVFLQELVEDALRVPEGHRLRADAQTALQWLGYQGTFEQWMADSTAAVIPDHVRAMHERFADGFLDYLREGKAPVPEMQPLFSRFRAWIKHVVKRALGLGVQFSPEVKGVVDRLFASDAAIAAAERQSGTALFSSAAQMGDDPLLFAAYQERMQRAHNEAVNEITKDLMAGWRREQSAHWKELREGVRRQVAAEQNQVPVYVAQSVIRTGKLPDGSPAGFGTGEPLKLSKDAIVAQFGLEMLKRLPKPYLYTVTGGVDPAVVAQFTGFPSADAMLEALATAPAVGAVIDRETDSRMLDQHGERMLDGVSLREAAEAAVTDHRRQVVAAELRALMQGMTEDAGLSRMVDGRVVPNVPSAQVMRAQADQAIAQVKVRDLQPNRYRAAAARASQQAFDLLNAGDRRGALEAKKRELLALEYYRAARAAQDFADKTQRRMQQLDTSPTIRGRMGKAGVQDQIDQILERYEFRRVSNKVLRRRESLLEYLQRMEAEGNDVSHIPPEVVTDARRINWRQLTVEELEGVRAAVEAIAHLGRTKDKLLTLQKDRQIEDAAIEVVLTVEANAPGRGPMRLETETPKARREQSRAELRYSHRLFANLMYEMDGFTHGPLWNLFVRPLNEASDYKVATLKRTNKWMEDLLNRHYSPSEQLAMQTELKYFRELGQPDHVNASITKMGRLMYALNWGNKDNKQRLRDGFGWTDQQVEAVIHSLDDRDWDFVIAVWQEIDSFWPEIAAKMKRLTGLVEKKVEALPFTLPSGRVIPGGYFPIAYNRKLNAKARGQQLGQLHELHQAAAGMSIQVKRNHEKARTEADIVGRGLRLDFGVIAEHLEDVVHSLAYHEVLLDMGRILRRPEVQKAIYATFGEEAYALIAGQLEYVAQGEREVLYAMDKYADKVRRGGQVVALGLNFTTPLIQITGLATVAARAGYVPTMKAAVHVLANPIGVVRRLQRESLFLKNRFTTQSQNLHEMAQRAGQGMNTYERLVDAGSRKAFRGRTLSEQQNGFFRMITIAQSVVDAIAYMAARDEARRAGKDPETARALGEQMVRDTQSSGEAAYISEAMRGGPYKKLFTSFFGPMVALHNVWVDKYRHGRRRMAQGEVVGGAGEIAAAFLTLYALGPAIATVLREAAKGDLGDDDDAQKWLWECWNIYFGRFFGVRDAAQAISSGFGYEGPPGLRPVGDLVSAAQRMGNKLKSDEPLTWDNLKVAIQAGGALAMLPTGAVLRFVDGVYAYKDGETSNPLAPIFGYDRNGFEDEGN